MNLKNLFIWSLVCILCGCVKEEPLGPNEVGTSMMKTVSISAGMDGAESRASLDSKDGTFTWQSGDLISVLATDGKYYDFILEGEAGKKTADFVGQIPVECKITTVATYPRIVANGTVDTLLNNNILNYVLPAEWNYARDVSNVPMVANFEEGAEVLAFKQVGGVMRFPVKNMPNKATFVVTMNNKAITGQFPVDITSLGDSYMLAADSESQLVINYSSDVDGENVEINVPVPVGTYNDFNVSIKDAAGKTLFTKDYTKDNTVNRATLLMMKELVLDERPMVISDVWPFFVDARVVFGKYEGVEQYAFYVDGSGIPIIKDVENLGDNKVGALIGGGFGHNTKHTVSVAKVVDGTPVLESKSEVVEFTTADIRQLTTNTGTKFVSVGWDDVSISNGPKYVDGKWTVVNTANYPDLDAQGRKLHQKRGYQVQLLAADKTTVIYDMIPFDGHSTHQNAFYDSNLLGKTNGNNILTPTAMAFGHLEPGKDYYFRVKTLDGVVNIDFEKGNYIAEGNIDKPYPYPLSSERGGCGWSDLVKLSTDAVHAPSANEIFHEGFDDIMISFDYVNWAVGVVPDLETTKRQGWSDYVKEAKTAYPAFLQTPVEQRKWTVHTFNQRPTVVDYGMLDNEYVAQADNILNVNAGSMQGWVLNTSKVERNIYPMFGAIAIGQAVNSHGGSSIATPAINSDKLLNALGTKCVVTMKVSYISANKVPPAPKRIYIGRYQNGSVVGEKAAVDVSEQCSEQWNANYVQYHTDANNYVNHQYYYEVKHEMYLKKGESIWIEKTTEGSTANREYGWYIIGDIKVEVVPGAYDEPFEDNGVGTEPDDTNYDFFGLGEFPISYWYTVEPEQYTDSYDAQGNRVYSYEKTKARYQEIKDAGFNIATYYGHSIDRSIAENKRIHDICEELGLKFIGNVAIADNATRISQIKEIFGNSNTYLGEILADEPSATKFDELAEFVDAYKAELPNKEVYINLLPMYAKSNALGTATYEEHINQYLSKINTKSLSYDFYALLEDDAIQVNYFRNADLVRYKTLAVRKPYWLITQAGKLDSRRVPTEVDQRWSVWSAIAGGAKGISYFCYWTPSGETWLDESYMITQNGEKTEMYGYVQKINSDIRTIGKKLMYCHADGPIMTYTQYLPLYTNDGSGRSKYGPIQNVSGDRDVLCGCFRDARIAESGENFKGYKALVLSETPNNDITANLTLDSSISGITITHNNTTSNVTLSNLLDVTVGRINVAYNNSILSLSIPRGEAVLLEF